MIRTSKHLLFIFSHDSPWICLQITRFPVVGLKSSDTIKWNRRVLLRIPIFHDLRGLVVEWREFVIIVKIIHIGMFPTEDQYNSLKIESHWL